MSTLLTPQISMHSNESYETASPSIPPGDLTAKAETSSVTSRGGLIAENMSALSTQSSDTASSFGFRGKRIMLTGLSVTAGIALLTIGLSLHVFVVNEFALHGTEIVTTARLGPVLAVTYALAFFLVASVPFVVRMLSCRLAWSWLKSSVDANGLDRPTPFQLGIIMDVLRSGDIAALLAGLRYMSSDKRSSYRPPIFRYALGVLGLTLGLAYTFVVVLIIFGGVSHALSFSQVGAYSGSWPKFSRQINATACATTAGAVVAGINFCGLYATGTNPFGASLPEGLRTLTNTSLTNAVGIANDGTALIIPASLPVNLAFYASTYGISTSCQSVTQQCVSSASNSSNFLALSCPPSVAFDAAYNTTTGSYPFGIIDPSGTVYSAPYLVDSNSFRFGAVVQSQAYDGDANSFVDNTGFYTYGAAGVSYNVLTCTVTVRQASYSYFDGAIIIDPTNSTTVADLNVVRSIAAMTTAEFLSERVPLAVDGTGADYPAAFAKELSREMIAFSAALFAADAAAEVRSVQRVLGSQLSLPVLCVMLALVVAYCILTIVLATSSVLAAGASPYTMLASKRLSEPTCAVNAAYGRSEIHRTWEQTNERMFSVETGLDRLIVGPMSFAAGGLAFGVARGVQTASR
ncbi:unnamed protein product [Mycena citricolor]|uniref:Uncharacterized protein n=1 Tax=Mycena citricolor TaxID=2018698 RepID=A0AAD2HQH6_9AGAR|nr:unnamed protein product [Mycena citricolor]